jgi:hypothetical protein
MNQKRFQSTKYSELSLKVFTNIKKNFLIERFPTEFWLQEVATIRTLLYRKVEEELVRVGRELKEAKENGEKETRTRKQLETALKVKQTNILNINATLC